MAPPCRATPAFSEVRRWAHVFEGVAIERWREITLDGWRPRVLHYYRFQILRDWTYEGVREAELTHGWYEGSPFMEGRYPSYELGRRYLVAAVSHDSPAHSFTTSCAPGAEGAAIAPVAAELGPPRATFTPEPLPGFPWWRPLARDAQNAVRFGVKFVSRLTDAIGSVVF